MEGITVYVYRPGYDFLGYDYVGYTDSLGRYAIDGLADNSYYLWFVDNRYPSRYADLWYRNGRSLETGAPVTIQNGLPQIADMYLDESAYITGRVLDSSGGGVADICVTAWDQDPWSGSGTSGRFAKSSSNGEFSIWGLHPGSPRLELTDCRFPALYRTVWYRDATNFASASPIEVSAGETISGIEQTVELTESCLEIDTDGDGLNDCDEQIRGTDPSNADTDWDGLDDGSEVNAGTDPTNPDSDHDRLSDGSEVLDHGTDPLVGDTDGDRLGDGDEVLDRHTDPLDADSDDDGLSDGDEVLDRHTDPLNADTDGDRLEDGQEVSHYRTAPLKRDTDGDGFGDGLEVLGGDCHGVALQGGSDPNDATSTPVFSTGVSHPPVVLAAALPSACE